jgi:hypothetical protein
MGTAVGVSTRSSALLLLGTGSGVDRAVVRNGRRAGYHWFGIRGLGWRRGDTSIASGGDIDLYHWLLRGAVVGGGPERAATWQMANGRLCPTLALDWNAGGAKILLELVGVVVGSMIRGASIWDAALAPGLSSELILSGAELASGLSLLLERLLLLCVGVSDLNLHFFTIVLDGEVVELLDDLFAGLTRLESDQVD